MRTLSTAAALFAATAALSHNILLIGASGKNGETVTIGTDVFELSTDGTVEAGRHLVDLTGSAANTAAGTLTTTGNAVADETVTIGARVYTWKTALTAANQVLIGADAGESLDNLEAAVMGGPGAGTIYGTGTVAHASANAVRIGATLVATAKVRGSDGNAIATTETMTNASWGAATLTGAIDATATQTRDAIVAAINLVLGAQKCQATPVTGGLLFVDGSGRGSKPTTETLSGSGNNWVATTTFGADYGGTIPNIVAMVQRAVTSAEATAGRFVVALPAAPVAFSIEVRASTGARKAWDGVAQIVGNSIILDNSGSTDLAQNDVVVVSFAV